MRPKIRFVSTRDPQVVFEPDQDEFFVGRLQGCAVMVNDPLVSRRHARVRFESGRYILHNLGRNPTRINGALTQEQVLQDGDRLYFGQTEFMVRVDEPVMHATHPPPDESKTVVISPHTAEPASARLTARISDGKELSFPPEKTILIGRRTDCDICLQDSTVSRRHAKIYFDGKRWCLKDLGSENGTFLDGRPITQGVLSQHSNVQLGSDGPVIWFRLEGMAISEGQRPDSMERVADYYFGDQPRENAGDFTMMLRGAYQQVKKKHSTRYRMVIAAIAALLVVSSAIGVYNYLRLQNAKEVAVDIFYNMKAMSLHIAKIERMIVLLSETAQFKEEAALKKEVAAKRKEVRLMEDRYLQFIEKFDIKKDMSEEDKIIMRVARIFGECDINIPDGFLKEVKKYINKWRRSTRLKNAIRRIEENKYAPIIYRIMVANGLPPQFLYLALQESSFNARAVGRETRFGIAKGIWQFIPSTAREYGLHVGPLANNRIYDPRDERFDFNAATKAAAEFLRDIYNTDAQASGLLVMASYNWGPTSIRKRIRQMPENPRDRNFWNLLKSHKIPKETYDYVFYIVSAAAIGENPGLFGFEFDNPLANLETPAVVG